MFRNTITAILSRAAVFAVLVISALAQSPSSWGQQAGLTNPGFEEPRVKEGTYQLVETIPGWKTTDTEFEIWGSGFLEVPAHEGTQFAELNAWIDGTLYQDSTGIEAGSLLEFTFAHRGRNGDDIMKLTITDLGADNAIGGGDDTVLFTKQYTTGNDAWAVYDSTTEHQIKALGNTVRFAYGAIAATGGNLGQGNLLDAANFGVGVVSAPPIAAGATETNRLGMELKLIPAGTFLMGSPDSEAGRDADERQHAVTITRDFYIGVTEVTQSQWQQVMGTTPWKGQEYVLEGDDVAASYISWNDAFEFCRKLSQLEGRTYRLPTEAEWEYACRAGTTTAYSFGDDASQLEQFAWYFDSEPAHPSQVKLKSPNGFGLFDVHGNVWEFCQDWYGDYPQDSVTDPTGPADGTSRVFRGGEFLAKAPLNRSAHRNHPEDLDGRKAGTGLRVVMVPGSDMTDLAMNEPKVAPPMKKLINASFEEPRVNEGSFAMAPAIPGWKTTDSVFEMWSTGYGGFEAHDGTQFVELNARLDGTLYQDLTGIGQGTELEFSFAHRGRNGNDTMMLTITDLGPDNTIGSDDDRVLFVKEYTTGKEAWEVYTNTSDNPIVALGNTIRFAYTAVFGTGGRGPDKTEGNFLDSVNFGIGVVSAPAISAGDIAYYIQVPAQDLFMAVPNNRKADVRPAVVLAEKNRLGDGEEQFTLLSIKPLQEKFEEQKYLAFEVTNLPAPTGQKLWLTIGDENNLIISPGPLADLTYGRSYFLIGEHKANKEDTFFKAMWVNDNGSASQAKIGHADHHYFLTNNNGNGKPVFSRDLKEDTQAKLDLSTQWQLVPISDTARTEAEAEYIAQAVGHIIVTEDLENQKGAVWSEEKISFQESFAIYAEVYLGTKDDGADGLALVFQASGNDIVSDGKGLGYEGISPSIAIEFDTYQNRDELNDPVQDHVGLRIDGDPKHVPSDFVEVGNLEDGKFHPIIVEWNANQQTLNLWLDGKQIFKEKSIPGGVDTRFAGQQVYFGFTASTGLYSNLHQVRSISLLKL